MSNPSNNSSFDLDPYDRLAQMLDGGLFKLLPLPPSWAKYVGAQYADDPSLSSAPAPAIPGFRKLPDLMKAQAPVDPGPPSFDPLLTTPLVPTPDPTLPPTIGPEAMLFRGPGAIPTLPPLPAPWSDYVRAQYAPDSSPGSTPSSDTPGFDKSPALLGTRALLPADSLTFNNSFGRDRPTHDPGDIQLAAGGDLRCQGFSAGCPNGGSRGTTGWFSVEGRRVCESCAVRMLGLQDEPPSDPDRIRTLRWYMIRGGR